MPERPPSQVTTYLIAIAAALVTIVGAWEERTPHPLGLRILFALMQTAPIIYLLAIVVARIRQLDEFELRIHLNAAAMTLVALIVVTYAYGMLTPVAAPALSWTYIAPLVAGLWLASYTMAASRYQV
ncbi:MAG: hypothetical protein DLM53_06065 [Candidatus Eremiobacter antarcticus]|nr:hypothetical protein [Candidatus Eremiobacteraeota bacterium]PZR62381.1 MAG: hypothetical protein DLM53_06065 [Candidatus Eremiobacter sp. RRmetagenome_bin22]